MKFADLEEAYQVKKQLDYFVSARDKLGSSNKLRFVLHAKQPAGVKPEEELTFDIPFTRLEMVSHLEACIKARREALVALGVSVCTAPAPYDDNL